MVTVSSIKIPFAITEGCGGIQSVKLGINQKNKIRSASAERLYQEIKSYLTGRLRKFSKYRLNKEVISPFALKVLQVTSRIPYGKVKTYSEIAKSIGSPRAARAVGNALNKNPFPILVPCHRVICKNGFRGGFAAGARIKKQLLDLERVNSK